MADFLTAYAPLARYEGGWCNDPADRGGETYAGIARNFFPAWPGWALIDAAAARRESKVSTSKLNQFLTDLREFGHTVVDGKRRLRMHYVTQTGTKPPTFAFFVNHPDLANDTYQRYVENRMREKFDLKGTPVRIRFRAKSNRDEKEGR